MGNILGLPVVAVKSSNITGYLKDILLYKESLEVEKLIFKNKGSYTTYFSVGTGLVKAINENAVVVRSCDYERIRKKEVSAFGQRLAGCIPGLKIIMKNGYEPGYVYDLMIDLENWYISALIVTDGLLTDIMNGRKTLLIHGNVKISKGMIYSDESLMEVTI